MKKEIVWGSIPIIGLESDEDIQKYGLAQQIAMENGRMRKYIPKEKSAAAGKKSGSSRTGRKASTEHCESISVALKGKPKSEEHCENLSKSKTGKKQSKETIEKKKVIFSGAGNPMYNKNHTKKTRDQISENHGAKVIKKCPHCGKECPANNYPRYHGDNCKLKK
jgi:hypothetical protein